VRLGLQTTESRGVKSAHVWERAARRYDQFSRRRLE
jgi:hypothetical protein